MTAQKPELTVKKPKGIDEKIRKIYVNYMKLMLEAATNEDLKEELFTSNKKRLHYLNNEVGMKIPDGVHVIFQTGDLHSPKIYVKGEEGEFWIREGSAPFSIVEKLSNGETVTDTMWVAKAEEIDLGIHESFKEAKIVLKLPFLDPTKDLTLFELKFDDKEIVLSTCAL